MKAMVEMTVIEKLWEYTIKYILQMNQKQMKRMLQENFIKISTD